MKTARRPRFAWITRNVFALGLVSLLNDTASEMAIPLLPAFITVVLAAGPLTLGWIEGAADAIAALLKYLSGIWSDRTGRQRPFVLGGYALASIIRPFLALATVPLHVLGIRVGDRMGKGIRTSPRDALLAASTPEENRGAAFGFHRAMDHAGAVLGPLVALGILALSANDLRLVFALTAIPGALAVLAVLIGVREQALATGAAEQDPADARPKEDRGRLEPLSTSALVRFLLPLALFTLGNASDVFLLYKAGAEKTPLYGMPLLWVGLHIVKMVSVIPGGALADRWGKRRTIALGWLFYAAIYAGFAFAAGTMQVTVLFLAYGLYYGLTEGSEKALIAQISPGGSRGTAFGWYHMTLGLMTLPASLLFGLLYEAVSGKVAFLVSASLAFVASLLLIVLSPRFSKGSTDKTG